VRAVGLHADVIVATSRAFQTTCTLVRTAGEALDSGAKKPTAEVKSLLEAARLLGAA
jgi:hypothetical protein